jgi:hypothetical protein
MIHPAMEDTKRGGRHRQRTWCAAGLLVLLAGCTLALSYSLCRLDHPLPGIFFELILDKSEPVPFSRPSTGMDAVVFFHEACSFHHGVRVVNDALGRKRKLFLNLLLSRYPWYFAC